MTKTWFGVIVQEAPAPSPLCASEGGKESHLAEIALFIKVVIIFSLIIICQGVTLIQKSVVCIWEKQKETQFAPQQFIAIMIMLTLFILLEVSLKYFNSHSSGKYDPDLDDLWRSAIKVSIFWIECTQKSNFLIKLFKSNIEGALRLCIKV